VPGTSNSDEGNGAPMNAVDRMPLGCLPGWLQNRGIDAFICSASYESRCRSVPDAVDPQLISYAIVCENDELQPPGKENAEYLRKRFESGLSTAALSRIPPIQTADNLTNSVLNILQGGAETILVDVTTFTHESLMILLGILGDLLPENATLFCAYTPASDYAPGVPKELKWLSKGLHEIRSVLGYPGRMLPSRKVHLVVLVGFESERAAKVVEAYEPAVLSLGLGDQEGSVNEKLFDINRYFHGDLARTVPRFVNFTFSCVNPWEACAQIENEIARHSGCNVIIAPMNTKLSTIGAVLAARKNLDIQLCYAQAEYYNTRNYSLPSDECILFALSMKKQG
jgi:hypothetical protein